MNILKKLMPAVLALLTVSAVFAGASRDKGTTGTAAVQRVRIAHTQASAPYNFVNDKGESDGFEVAVMKAVDELIPDYEFEFVPTSDDDLLIGIETGKYAGGTKGAWITEERKQKFIIPNHYVAASVIGIAFRSENSGEIKDLESFARFSGKLVPIPPQSAQYSVVEDFNKAHPDTPIHLVPSDVFIITDAYTWVVEGRYDAFFDLKLTFQRTVEDQDGAWHAYANRLSYAAYKAIPTYPLFNKQQQDLAGRYEEAIRTLASNGTLGRLSLQYFGEDIFQYI
ncbi:MAG: transporter substrate-binding domain-containing protein [Treponema sp.]|jgi:L-cystine transport system substrate-binding protein|nr:transporter substrate-binding domain-containing protein [Treponema sp.]